MPTRNGTMPGFLIILGFHICFQLSWILITGDLDLIQYLDPKTSLRGNSVVQIKGVCSGLSLMSVVFDST